MGKSKQSMKKVTARGDVLQQSRAENAEQTMDEVSGEAVEQKALGTITSEDLPKLTEQLELLITAMKSNDAAGDHDPEIKKVTDAKEASKKGVLSATLQHLKPAGEWALTIAEKIGVDVAVSALKSSIGLDSSKA